MAHWFNILKQFQPTRSVLFESFLDLQPTGLSLPVNIFRIGSLSFCPY